MDKKLFDCGLDICRVIGEKINGETVRKLNKDDAQLIISFADKHNILSILGCAIENSDYADDFDSLSIVVKKTYYKQMKFDVMCDKISDKLSKNNIRHIVIKGSEIQKFYPDNIIRSSTDIDIHIDKKDVDKAIDVMTELGFSHDILYSDEELPFKKEPRYNVELHTTLEGFSKEQKKILLHLSDNAELVKNSRYRLTDSDTYIHALFHLYKHFVVAGAGVRMLLDIYVIKKFAHIDEGYVQSVLDKLGILEFAEVIDNINDTLFGDKNSDDEVSELISFIFESGVFGTNTANHNLYQVNGDLMGLNKTQRFIMTHGLSYKIMKKRYPILQKLPVLYPFSFVHRFFYGIIHKKDVIRNEKKRIDSITQKQMDKYKRILKISKIIK